MASAHIEITGTTNRLNSQVRSFIDQLQQIVEKADQLKAIADQAAMGGDWAGLATAFGFTGETAAADAETFYNLLGSATGDTALHNTFIEQLLSRFG